MKSFLFEKKITFWLISIVTVLICLVTTIQAMNHGPKTYADGGIEYSDYNNYIIFKQSFFHLIHNQDLYSAYPKEQWDLYKYSPTFSLFMGVLAYLPDGAGLYLWSFLNAFVLFFAIWKLPFDDNKKRILAFAFLLIELITSLQNEQSNGLMAGLIIFSFNFLERKKMLWATLCVVLTLFIKLFGIVAFVLFLFYPQKGKAILYTITWFILLAILPLLAISFEQYGFLLQSWVQMLKEDHNASVGFSVSGWLYTWFELNVKNSSLLIGTLLFSLPLLRFKLYSNLQFKLLYLASVLIWVVIFNHKAESPTFVIAVSGIAIWFFTQTYKIENLTLLLIALLFTVLAATDLFPKSIRENYFIPYVVKTVPCILIWVKIVWEQITVDTGHQLNSTLGFKKKK